MPRNRGPAGPKVRSSGRMCPFRCGAVIQLSQVCCKRDWQRLPAALRQQWLDAKDAACDNPDALEAARDAISEYARRPA